MKPDKICQSCSMPLDSTALMGTEKDGSKSQEYCVYCYKNGQFLSPNMNINEMKTLIREKMGQMHIEPAIIKMAEDSLPHLKRWRPAKAVL